MKPSQQELMHARTLWDFHRLQNKVTRADFILAAGSHDERVAEHAARLFLDGMASLLVTSGGFGKVTRNVWRTSEGERFAQIAEELGVPKAQIVIEPRASNTGDNIVNTRALLVQRGLHVSSGIVVTKPYMCRRAFATAAKQWPEVTWQVDAPQLAFDAYPNADVPLQRMINLMVGDLQRLKVYASQGFQIEQEIPVKVWESYEYLKDAGYDEFVIGTE